MQTYLITCLNCNAERTVKIHQTAVGDRIDWMETPENANHPIMSGRKRLDDQWGWQCKCSNDSRLTKQEQHTFSNPAAPKPQELNDIVKNLKPADIKKISNGVEVDKFRMQAA